MEDDYFVGIVITVIAILLFIKPRMTPILKMVELGVIVFVSYKQPLLGILCAAVFIQQMPVEGMVSHKKSPTRMALDEQVRPKDSNLIRTLKSGGIPPETALTGQVARPFVENHTGGYTPF